MLLERPGTARFSPRYHIRKYLSLLLSSERFVFEQVASAHVQYSAAVFDFGGHGCITHPLMYIREIRLDLHLGH
jgi:hypothetical protein